MMFILNGNPISPDVAFTHDGIQYPANWLRLASPEERAAIGITEAPEEPFYDQRFYWGVNNPKHHTELVKQWVGTTKMTAGSLLNPYDWYIVRQTETGKAVPQAVLDYRTAVRDRSDDRETMIKNTTSTDELCMVITQDFSGLFPWPTSPFSTPPVDPVGDVINVDLPPDQAASGSLI